jgi:acyl-coenzyme A thioesterase PaaI-like protein
MKANKDHGIGHRTSSTPPRKKNFCFGCGRDNAAGMRLKFTLDETGKQFVCHFRLGKCYTGPPGFCHGGVIATILDEAMAKLNRLFDAPAPTSRMTVEYLHPVPLNRPLEVWSKNISKRGRRLTHSAEIRNEKGTVLARGRGIFVIIDHKHVFRSAR